eukprot:128228_1
MRDPDTLQIIAIVVAVVLWLFIYTPLLIYHGLRYYKSSNHIVYQARYAHITIYEVVFMTMKLIYGCFDNAMQIWLLQSFTYQLIDSVNVFLAYFVLYSFVWRFWCIHYTMLWTKYVVENEWKTIINPNHKEHNNTIQTSNWYLNHKETFGNYKWIKWRIFIIAIFFSLCYIIGSTYSSYSSNAYLSKIWASWPYILPLIFLVIVYCKTPSFLDHFHVQKEMKYIFVLLCIDYISYYGGLIAAILIDDTYSDININIMLSITSHFVIAAQFGAVMISTYWVNIKVNSIIAGDRYKTKDIIMNGYQQLRPNSPSSLKTKVIEIEPTMQKMSTVDYSINISKPLLEFLSHTIAFSAFMTHLSYELSLENILSFVEFLQFQKYVLKQINDNENEQQLLCDIVVLPDTVPLSAIVYDDKIDIKHKAYLLYKKYISDDSPYTINISWKTRKNVMDLMRYYDQWMVNDRINNIRLLNLFDQCCNEMRETMQDSYTRFKLTQQYHNIVDNILFIK